MESWRSSVAAFGLESSVAVAMLVTRIISRRLTVGTTKNQNGFSVGTAVWETTVPVELPAAYPIIKCIRSAAAKQLIETGVTTTTTGRTISKENHELIRLDPSGRSPPGDRQDEPKPEDGLGIGVVPNRELFRKTHHQITTKYQSSIFRIRYLTSTLNLEHFLL